MALWLFFIFYFIIIILPPIVLLEVVLVKMIMTISTHFFINNKLLGFDFLVQQQQHCRLFAPQIKLFSISDIIIIIIS